MASPIVLRPRKWLTTGLEAGVLRPDALATMAHEEILALRLPLGRRFYRVGDLFTVEGERSDTLVIEGDAGALRGLGAGMAGGRLVVCGNAGPRVGAEMSGGDLVVEGDAGPCAGLGMRGGVLRIAGDVGERAGGGWPGATSGMAGGRLIVEGRTGPLVGERMRRGVIVLHGPAGERAGLAMRGGTIIALQGLGPHFGAGMSRGTLLSFGPAPLWAAFRYDCLYDPVFVRLYLRTLDLDQPADGAESRYERYHGDINGLGKGEVLLWRPLA